MILQTLAERAMEYARGMRVVDYCACLRAAYVVVRDEDGKEYIGMSHIPHEDLHNHRESIRPDVDNLLRLVRSLDVVNRSLGLALINAISQKYVTVRYDEPPIEEPVCVIGNLGPLVKELSGKKVYVFERSAWLRGNALSDAEEELLIPECRTNIITGMTLLNFTLERILEISRGTNVLTGPSAGFYPEWAKGTKIHYVQSMKFHEIDRLRDFLKAGNFVSLKTHNHLGEIYSRRVS
ncbi:MAG: Rossmann-like domain-containing protein [Thermoprotei archaeon]